MLDFLPQIDPQFFGYAIAALVAVAAALFARRGLQFLARLRWRRAQSKPADAPKIDLEQLAPHGPSTTGPRLQFYNLPVRLVVIVLAPVGRGNALPSRDRLLEIIDQIVPGLKMVAAAHGTTIKLWPPQLSTPGFSQALFSEIRLPGNRGKGTPWSAVAGRFSADGKAYLAGMAVRAATANNLSQVTLSSETEWLEVLRCAGD